MARTFNGSSDYVKTSLGATSSVTGDVTIGCILRRAAGHSGTDVIMSIGGASKYAFYFASDNLLTIYSTTSASAGSISATSSNNWVFVGVSKSSGSSTARLHRYVYDTNTWSHADGSATGSVTPSGDVWLGSDAGPANYFQGDIAAAGVWAAKLTDAQIEALAYSLSAWWAVQPNGLWILDQVSTSQKVVDLSGGGANESAISGTSVSTSAVPVWSYGAPIIVPTRPAITAISLAASPAEVTVTPQALGLTPGTASVALTPATVTVTPQALGVTPGTVSLAASPAEVTVMPAALDLTPGTASVALTPASLTVTPQALGISSVVTAVPGRYATHQEHTYATHQEHTAATGKEL